MSNTLHILLAAASGLWLAWNGDGSALHLAWDRILAPIAALAMLVSAAGFLFLVGRLCWGVQQFVATCRERQRIHQRMVEMLSEYLESQSVTADQMWSASAALSPC